MTKPKILIALGSPSPSDRGLLSQLSLDDSVEYILSIASAHRTPETVEKHFNAHPWDAIVPGAGLTNALLSDYLRRVRPQTLVVGLPIEDKSTKGLSSVLSSQELPPGYVAASGGLGQLGKSAKIAAQLVTTPYDRVAIFDFVTSEESTTYGSGEKAVDLCSKLGVECRLYKGEASWQKVEPGELPLAILVSIGEAAVIDTDKPVIGMTHGADKNGKTRDYHAGYIDLVKQRPNLAMVGFDNATNLALFGAKVVSRADSGVAKRIEESYLPEGKKKYDPFKELIPLDTPEKIKRIVEAK